MVAKQFDAPSAPVDGQPANIAPGQSSQNAQGQPSQYPPGQAPQYPAQYAQGEPPQHSQYPPQDANGQAPQYEPNPPVYPDPSQWTSGLYGCCDDCFSCCLTCCLPCVAFGQIAQKVDDGDQTFCFINGLIYAALISVGVPCCYSCLYRQKMRAKFHLPEVPCNDICTHLFCELCALCQEYRELKNHGIDPMLSSPQPIPMVMMAPHPPVMKEH